MKISVKWLYLVYIIILELIRIVHLYYKIKECNSAVNNMNDIYRVWFFTKWQNDDCGLIIHMLTNNSFSNEVFFKFKLCIQKLNTCTFNTYTWIHTLK